MALYQILAATDRKIAIGHGYTEKLTISKDSVNMGRMGKPAGIPLLDGHTGPAVGRVEEYEIRDGVDADGDPQSELWLAVKMMDGEGSRSAEIKNLWDQGIAHGVSIGYRYDADRANLENDEITVNRWELLESSVVGVGADDETSVMRSLKTDEERTAGMTAQPTENEPIINRDDKFRAALSAFLPDVREGLRKEVGDRARAEYFETGGDVDIPKIAMRAYNNATDEAEKVVTYAQPKRLEPETDASVTNSARGAIDITPETKRVLSFGAGKDLASLAFRHGVDFLRGQGQSGNTDGVSSAGMASALLAPTSWSGGQYREYTADFLNFLEGESPDTARFLRNSLAKAGQDAVPMLPFAFSREMLNRIGKIDHETASYRVFSATGGSEGSEGGALITSSVYMDLYTNYLYNASALAQCGCYMLSGLTDIVLIPVEGGKLTSQFLAENATVPKSDFTFSQLKLEPHRISIQSVLSDLLVIQTSGQIQTFLEQSIMRSLAEQRENEFLNGTGTSNKPLGLLRSTGVLNVSHGTDGGAPTLANTNEYATLLAENNTLFGQSGWLTTPRLAKKRKETARFTGSDSETIWNNNAATPRLMPMGGGMATPAGMYDGIMIYLSNLLPTNGTKAGHTGADLHSEIVVMGNGVVIGDFGVPIITHDPYTKAAEGQRVVTVSGYCDIVARRKESLVIATDVDAS